MSGGVHRGSSSELNGEASFVPTVTVGLVAAITPVSAPPVGEAFAAA
jgi:hypothetical protein